MKFKSLFAGLAILVGTISLGFAQSPSQGSMEAPSGGSITGRVFSKDQKVAMEYTNVVLYRSADSSMVTGSITDKMGSFSFRGIRNGKYYLMIHFIGFNIKKIGNIEISNNHKDIRVPDIFLMPATATLKDVEVTARQPRVSYQIDKKVVDVSKDLTAAGGTAIDALQNVPSVNVDLEGNVTLRGSSNFTVLIDGRPSVLSGSDALQQIPASAIKSIEIITNPSAKYDPEGVGGIINIILKDERRKGLNGMIGGSTSTGNQYQGNLLLAYRKGKVSYSLSVNGNNRPMNMHATLDNSTIKNDTTNYRNSDIAGVRTRKGYRVKGGMDFYFTEKTNLFLSASVGSYGFGSNNNSHIGIYDFPQTFQADSSSISNSNRIGNYYSGQIDFLHKFNDLGHQIEMLVFYSDRKGDDKETQNSYATDANWIRQGEATNSIQTDTKDTSSDFRFKIDYALPVGIKGKFEAGGQARLGRETGQYDYMNYDPVSGTWSFNPDNSSVIDFTRNIYAAYVSFKDQIDKFGYELGFRGEYTDRSVNTNDGSGVFKIKRFDYFPSIYLSYKFTHNYQLYTSYTRRIDRPHGWDLNPFPIIIDPYNVRVGNPKLEPEYIDSYELGMQKAIGQSFISLEGYYRIGKNNVTRVLTLGDNGIIYHTSANLDKDYSLGMETMINLRLTNWFSFNVSGTVYHYRLTGNVTGSDVSANSTNWNTRFTPTFKLKHDFQIEFMGVYRSPTVTVQGSRKGFFFTNLALRKDFFDKKLNVILSARDLFKTAKWDMISSGTGFYSHSTFQRQSPIFSFSINYFINNYKQKPNRQQTPNEGEQGGDQNF
ncbi:MAG: TonB-dependent receptor [Bacteroidales bacterium]|nr:TonB-dependent receptor [Bacteroidales bacterium]